MCVCKSLSHSDSLQPCGLQPTRLLPPWNSPSKSTGVGCHSLFQCVCMCVCPVVSDCLQPLCNLDRNPPGSSVHGILQTRILDWVAISSSRVSSQPRDRTHVCYFSCLDRQVLYHWATWEAPCRRIVSSFYSWETWGTEAQWRDPRQRLLMVVLLTTTLCFLPVVTIGKIAYS